MYFAQKKLSGKTPFCIFCMGSVYRKQEVHQSLRVETPDMGSYNENGTGLKNDARGASRFENVLTKNSSMYSIHGDVKYVCP